MIAIASDHGGFDLKQEIVILLQERALPYVDHGTDGSQSVDYPDFAEKVASDVANGVVNRGILICGTGIGISIAANKFVGIRAALVHDEFTARMACEHNNANILVMGGRVLTPAQGRKLVEVWLDAEYEGGRHQNRLDKISALEGQVK